VTDKVMAPEQMARLFHDAYERLAPQFGYETRKGTRAFDPSTPNGKLMIATCAEVLAAAPSPAPVAKIEEPMDEPRREDYALDSLYFDDLRRYIDSLRAALVESENRACHHGWRGTVPDEGRSIQTPCPACGARSLFIGSGGHLTCSRVPSDRSDGCHSPSVEDTVKQLKQRAEQAESALAAAKAGAAPHQNADQPKAAPQAPCTPRRSSPGLAERPDSPNGVSLERAAILDETDSGVKPAGVAPRVGEERQQQVEDADYIIAKLEQRVLPEHGGTAHSMTHHWNLTVDDSAMHQEAAALIRALKGDAALKSKEGGAG
jgi:hypothetical protein